MPSPVNPDRRPPNDEEMRLRMAASQSRRENRRFDPALILAEGYLPGEVETVIALRKKRDQWQSLGVDALEYVLAELAAINREFELTQADASSPRMWQLYRSSRPLIGSTLDDGGKGFYPEFEPTGDFAKFSTSAIIARIEKGLEKFRGATPTV